MRTEYEQGRSILDRHARAQASLQRVEVLGDLAELLHVPAVRPEAGGHVVGVRQLGLAVDRDVVVVVDRDEMTEPKMPGERRRFVADALHEVAVAADREHVVVAELGAEPVAQVLLGQRDADRVADALTEWARRHLDAARVSHLGVTRGLRTPLPEVAQIVELEAEAAEVEHRVQEHRRVPGRQHEAITVRPVSVGRVVRHHPCEQDVREGASAIGVPG